MRDIEHEKQWWGSHLELLENIPIYNRNALEEGMGLFSTPTLLGRSDRLYSIEYDSKWYEEIVSLYNKFIHKWTPLLLKNDDLILNLVSNLANHLDYALVDGGRVNFRHKIAQTLLDNHCPVVIIHDWQDKEPYNYDQIIIPPRYNINIYKHNTGIETIIISMYKMAVHENMLKEHRKI